ncbi:hypothetical protein ACFXJ8_25880 [Nonomuraea sp. NPDC059194]|uniref:hypothetical protein n=1 Tax=Nonomuraea sp. NPDC059194 TaxID=3346764 RepID=UPI003682C2D8
MPDKPRTKGRNMRIWKWNALGVAAQKRGTNRTEIVNRLIDWWLATPGATLPDQLTPEEVEWLKSLAVKEDLANSGD